jgi:hypothetical protein
VREIGRPDHATTEQLSALLDDRAEPGEHWFLTDHVEECTACASELDGLRSVQSLLRAMPVHMPPRNFTIPLPIAQPRPRPSRLVPLTRALSALAAVLCVVFFSADALLLGSSAPKQFQDGAGAMQITTVTKTNEGSAPAARSAAESARPSAAGGRAEYPASAAAAPAPPAAEAPRPAAEAAKPADAPRPAPAAAAQPAAAPKPAAAAKPAEAAKPAAAGQPPGAPPAAPAAAPPPPAAAAPPAADAAAARSAAPAQAAAAPTLGPLGTIAPFQATQQPAVATMPPRATSAVVAAPAQAPADTGTGIAPAGPPGSTTMPVRIAGVELTVLRVGGFLLAIVAVVLLIWSLVLGRMTRAR